MESLKRALLFVKLMKIEPYLFLAELVMSFKKLALDQLIQDKLCLDKYNLSEEFCLNLPTMSKEEDTEQLKLTILDEVTQFNFYITISTIVPMLIMAFMIGPFLDNNTHNKKLVMLMAISMFLLEQILLLLNCYFFKLNYHFLLVTEFATSLLGGVLTCKAPAMSYLTFVTPTHLKAARLTLVEFWTLSALPIAIYIAGNLLLSPPLFKDELRNYSTIFVIGALASVVAFLLVFFLVDEQLDKQLFVRHFNSPIEEQPVKDMVDSKPGYQNEKPKQESHEEILMPKENILQQFFQLNNVKKMANVVLKSRPHQIRLQIIMLCIAIIFYQIASYSSKAFLFQYVQLMYSWNSSQFSTYAVLSSSINICSSMLFVPILLKVFHISDLNLALIGINFVLLQSIMRCVLSELFYYSLVGSLLNTVCMAGIRSYISKIVEPDELGRIFSLLQVLNVLTTMLSTAIFSSLFHATQHKMPTMVFFGVSLALQISIIMIFVVARKSKETLRLLRENPNLPVIHL